jgi:uncharacterized NAD(P)/FAD-binding protein YdhS
MREFTIVIAGGGASGALLATELLRQSPDVRVVSVEPRERLGFGTAYSTECPLHLLNVPAERMSAFADDAAHFVRWLDENQPGRFDPRSFVPRSIYGAYLSATVSQARIAAGARWRHVRALVSDVAVDEFGVDVMLSSGGALRADAFVVATGNADPAPWRGIPEGLGAGRFFGSAWDPEALVPASRDETVLLLGTGLTAIDAVLGLRYNGHRGTIYMVSRRGLLPHEHRVFDAPPATFPDAHTIRELMAAARGGPRDARGAHGNWRLAIDRVRPRVNALWKALGIAGQRRVVRHLMPYWSVHRHRMSPEAAKSIADLIAAGVLRTLAGRTGRMVAMERSLRVPVELRGEETTLAIEAGRVINCSGPEHNFRKLRNPLIRSLLARGLMTPYALDIGAEIADNGALIDTDGQVSTRLFSIGPARFGTLIETTAMPEIRVQARDLASLLGARASLAGAPV